MIRLEQLDLNLLLVFDVIYRERNLTRAADAMGLTQPAVSNALRRLRERLDSELFVATPSGMQPTAVADKMIIGVREALHTLNATLNEITEFEPAQSNKTFRFSMTDFSEALLLSDVMALLQAHAPQAAIVSAYESRDHAERLLATGQLDFAIDVFLPNSKNLRAIPVINEAYVCAVCSTSPLAKKRMSLNHYLAAQHVHVSSRRAGRGQVDIALEKLGQQRQISVRVQHYMIAAKLVENSELIWTVPKALAEQTKLVIKKLPFEVEPLQCQLYWHQSAEHDPNIAWLSQLLHKQMAL